MKRIKAFLARRAVKWSLRVLVALLVLVTMIGFLVLPPLVRMIAVKQASKALGRKVEIAQVRLNPYTLSATIRGLAVKERDGTEDFVRFDEIYVNVEAVSLFKLAPVLREIRIVKPYIHVVREDETHFNFSDIIMKLQAAPKPPPQKDSKPFRFSLNNIQVRDGLIRVEDKVLGKSHRLDSIQMTVPSVSNFPAFFLTNVQPHFSATLDGSPIQVSGRTQPFGDSLETHIDFGLQNLDIPYYVAYAPMKLNFQIPSGKLSMKTTLTYLQFKKQPPSLVVSGDVSLTGFQLNDAAGVPVLALPDLRLEQFSLRPLGGMFYCRKIAIARPELNVTRDSHGAINLLALAPARGAAAPAPKPQQNSRPFLLDFGQVALTDAKVTFNDLANSRPLRVILAPLNLDVRNFTTAPDQPADFACDGQLDQGGSFAANGKFSVRPIATQLHLDLKQLNICPYQVYAPDSVKLAVRSGLLSLTGDTTLALAEKGVSATFKGDLALDGLGTADPRTGEEFLKLKALRLTGMDIAYAPLTAAIEEIALDGLDTQFIMSADGKPNVSGLYERPPVATASLATEATPSPAQPASAPVITIQRVLFSAGRVGFLDRSVSPNYSTVLGPIDGKVERVSLDPNMTADINISASVDNTSPVLITGKLRPAKEAFLVDMHVGFDAIELSPVTPYTDKYLGYPVKKGKLTLDLEYRIQNRKLDSKNHIFFDQFTLGDRVESSTATKAPVKLAIALLTDRRGQIKLDVPVSGSLDDPKFRVVPVIVQVFVNLLEKAATSPFALVASLTGGGEEMSFVEFDYGSPALDATALKKLDGIVKLLDDRPALRFEVQPQLEPKRDTEALRAQFMQRKLKIQKLRYTLTKGEAAVPINDVKIEPQEYEKYLTLAYEAEDIPNKPRNALGIAKTVPPKEMEALLLANTSVAPDDLRVLAYRRAANIRDHLLASKTVEAQRVFLVEPQLATTEGGAEAKPRTQFNLSVGGEGAPPPEAKPFEPPPVTPQSSETVEVKPRSSWPRWMMIGGGAVVVVLLIAL